MFSNSALNSGWVRECRRFLFFIFVSVVLTGHSMRVFAADPPAVDPSGPAEDTEKTSESLAQFHKELLERKPELTTELASSDPAQVKKAIDTIDDWAKGAVASRRADIFEILVDTKHYDEAEERAIRYILKAPANNWSIEHLQKLRVKSLLKQGKNNEALSAAKVYYYVCRFAETKDAISLVSLCLDTAHPEDKTIAKLFKQQQVAWASTTQPTTGTIQPSLGDPVLESISIGKPPFDASDVEKRIATSYISLEAKGNLLLLEGQADEAKAVFDQAYDVATDKQASRAIENVARAIRAQNGSVGAANAYLMTVQQKQ
jgi:tetratricopeptide (TPR) repeat protein